MTEAYLAQWSWNTTNPLNPRWEPPVSGAVGSLDLRSLPQMALAGGTPQGWGIFTYPAPVVIAGALSLGSRLAANLSTPVKTAIRTRLALPGALTSNTLADVLFEILTTQADPTGLLRCKPLMPTIQRVLELILGGFSTIREETYSPGQHPFCLEVVKADWQRLQRQCAAARARLDAEGLTTERLRAEWLELKEVGADPESPAYRRLNGLLALPEPDCYRRHLQAILEQYRLTLPELEAIWGQILPRPLPHGTTISENWNCADSISPDCQLTWNIRQGDFDIVTNAAQSVADGGDRMDAATDLATDNHRAQVTLLNVPQADDESGFIRTRSHPTDDTQYVVYGTRRAGTDSWSTAKRVLGVFTEIGTETLVEIVANDVLRGDADGSSISRYRNGSLQQTVTDTSITGNLRCGVEADFTAGQRFDDFEAADLVVSLVPKRRLNVLLRR